MERLCPACRARLAPGVPFCTACGADVDEPAPAADPLLGTLLAGKFSILSLLGEGGMGRVYRAEQQPLGVEVCIKTLHPHFNQDRTVVKRFFREAQAASRLHHPNCVDIHDFGEADGRFYIAMELLRGRSLHDHLRDAPFATARAAAIAAQILDVLEAAHRMQIVHRDLKPENIMLEDLPTQADFVKVLDFGIAKVTDGLGAGGTRLTQAGMVFGTPAYIAPEQAMAQEVDARVDLYALGVILFEMLTGELPFAAPTPAALLHMHATLPAPPLQGKRPDLPAALALLVDEALAKQPAGRPPSALVFKERLLQAVRAPGEGAAPAPRAAPPPVDERAAYARTVVPVQPTAVVTPWPDKLDELRQILPSQVVDEVAEVRARVAAEKREVVALAVDLGGQALHEADPEAAAATLGLLSVAAAEVAERHGGKLQRSGGERLLLLFGVPVGHADDAERAVRAALALHAVVAAHPVTASSGIHGGQALVGAAVTGDALDLAQRLADAAAPGQILASEKIQRLVRAAVGLKPVPPLVIKGRTAAVSVFEVTSARPASSAVPGRLAAPPLCGRARELDTLLALAARLGGDGGQAVRLTGEPGGGKTRLLTELAEELPRRERTETFLVSLREDPVRRILADMTGARAPQQLGLPPAELRFLEGHLAGERPRWLGEQELRVATVSALVAALERLAARTRTAVLLDDAHLAEGIGIDLAARLLAAPPPRTLCVIAARDGYELPWAAAAATTIPLPPLLDGAIDLLVAGALEPTPAPAALAEAVRRRAGGSPLMALELLRGMIDSGVLVAAETGWALAGDPAAFPTPDGVAALVGARLDTLPPETRLVLALASCAGEDFGAEVVRKVVAGAVDVDRQLAELERRGLLQPTSGQSRLRFVQPSVREAAYARLVQATREQLHRRIGAALEPDPASDPAELARHFLAGADVARGLKYSALAVSEALERKQTSRAVAHLRRARDAARGSAALLDARVGRRFAEDSVLLGRLLLEAGELAEAGRAAEEGLAAARKQGEPALITAAQRLRGRTLLAAGKLDEAAPELEAALAAALGLRDRALLAELHADVGELWERRGEAARAVEYLLRALELTEAAQAAELREIALRVMNALGRAYLRWKNPDKAALFFRQALQLAQALDDKLGAERALGNLGAVSHQRGEHAQGIALVEQALALAHEIGDQMGVARQEHNLGALYLSLGDKEQAQQHLDAAYAGARRIGWREGMAAAAAALGRR